MCRKDWDKAFAAKGICKELGECEKRLGSRHVRTLQVVGAIVVKIGSRMGAASGSLDARKGSRVVTQCNGMISTRAVPRADRSLGWLHTHEVAGGLPSVLTWAQARPWP